MTHVPPKIRHIQLIAKVSLFILLGINLLYVLSGALHYPLAHIDVWANWLFKAKALYLADGSIGFLANWHGQFAHPHYPLLLPLLFAGIYALAGGVNEVLPSLISPLVFLCTLVLCFYVLKQLSFSTLTALFFTYFYSMLPPLLAQGGRFHAGMPDIYLALFWWVGLYCLISAKKHPSYSWLIVVVVIIASLVKTEGILIATLLLFTKERPDIKFVQILLSLIGVVVWSWYVQYAGIPITHGFATPNLSTFTRLPIIIKETLVEVFRNVNNWYWFWWLFFLGLCCFPAKQPFARQVLLPVTTLLASLLLGLYLLSTIPANGYVSSSLDRLLLQFSPIWFTYFALMFLPIARSSWQQLAKRLLY